MRAKTDPQIEKHTLKKYYFIRKANLGNLGSMLLTYVMGIFTHKHLCSHSKNR